MNVDHEKQKFNKNVHKILQIKTSIFLHFRWRAWAQFSKKCLYSTRNILIIFNIIFFIKFNYLNRTNKKLYFLTSMWFYYFLNIYLKLLPCFFSGNANLHHVVVPSVGANNLKTSLSVRFQAYTSVLVYYCMISYFTYLYLIA